MKFLMGLIVGVVLLPVFAYGYFRFGYAPVATAASELPFEKQFTNMALKARIDKENPPDSPLPVNEGNLIAGAQLYRENCMVCHASRDGNKTAIAKGMFPRPPLLLKGKGVTDDRTGETFWKVKNGIRLTGMPAFIGSLTDIQIWQVTLLLANADKLPPSVTAVLDK